MLLATSCSGPDGDLPESYRKLNVPEARLTSPVAQKRGRALFEEHCALCHGENADGRGERRSALDRAPADFTNTLWRQGVTPRKVFFVIREGERGTAMPSWKALSEDQTWDLVAYVLSVSER